MKNIKWEQISEEGNKGGDWIGRHELVWFRLEYWNDEWNIMSLYDETNLYSGSPVASFALLEDAKQYCEDWIGDD